MGLCRPGQRRGSARPASALAGICRTNRPCRFRGPVPAPRQVPELGMMDRERFDAEGYLRELGDWNEALATEIAAQDQLTLTPAHWDIIYAIRNFYREFELSPTTRVLLKYLG